MNVMQSILSFFKQNKGSFRVSYLCEKLGYERSAIHKSIKNLVSSKILSVDQDHYYTFNEEQYKISQYYSKIPSNKIDDSPIIETINNWFELDHVRAEAHDIILMSPPIKQLVFSSIPSTWNTDSATNGKYKFLDAYTRVIVYENKTKSVNTNIPTIRVDFGGTTKKEKAKVKLGYLDLIKWQESVQNFINQELNLLLSIDLFSIIQISIGSDFDGRIWTDNKVNLKYRAFKDTMFEIYEYDTEEGDVKTRIAVEYKAEQDKESKEQTSQTDDPTTPQQITPAKLLFGMAKIQNIVDDLNKTKSQIKGMESDRAKERVVFKTISDNSQAMIKSFQNVIDQNTDLSKNTDGLKNEIKNINSEIKAITTTQQDSNQQLLLLMQDTSSDLNTLEKAVNKSISLGYSNQTEIGVLDNTIQTATSMLSSLSSVFQQYIEANKQQLDSIITLNNTNRDDIFELLNTIVSSEDGFRQSLESGLKSISENVVDICSEIKSVQTNSKTDSNALLKIISEQQQKTDDKVDKILNIMNQQSQVNISMMQKSQETQERILGKMLEIEQEKLALQKKKQSKKWFQIWK